MWEGISNLNIMSIKNVRAWQSHGPGLRFSTFLKNSRDKLFSLTDLQAEHSYNEKKIIYLRKIGTIVRKLVQMTVIPWHMVEIYFIFLLFFSVKQ